MVTAFVAGATGYTGREVVRRLVARGVTTIAHVRPDRALLDELSAEFARDGAQVSLTPWDEAALVERLTAVRPDIVFALLGTTRHRATESVKAGAAVADSYESVDYALTAMLVRAAAAAAAAVNGTRPRFVYLSALGAGSPSGAYFAARFKAERDIEASGLPYVIARPSFITGPDRPESRLGERVGAALVDGVTSFMSALGAKGLSARYASMTAKELAAALVSLSLDPAATALTAEPERLREVATAAASAAPAR
jgi:uncharacterized protein YbjT (DUF2867 family)